MLTYILAIFMVLAATVSAEAQADDKKPQLKMMIFREDCYDKFFVQQQFNDQECIKFTASKGIGLAIIAGSGILKVPQIINILKSGSTAGLSPFSNYVETVSFMQTCAFSIAHNVPFSVYGETLIITVQNIVIVLLIWNYDKSVGLANKAIVGAMLIGYSYALFTPGIINEDIWMMIQGSGIATGILCRVPQIWTIFS